MIMLSMKLRKGKVLRRFMLPCSVRGGGGEI